MPDQITRVPKTPKFLEGVINLRGEVLPVVDQRRRFDMPQFAGERQAPAAGRRAHRAPPRRADRRQRLGGAARARRRDRAGAGPDRRDRRGWCSGVINLEPAGRMVLLLDPAELLSRAERGLLDGFEPRAGPAAV